MESVWGQSGTPLRAVGGGVFAGRMTDFSVETGPDNRRRVTETIRGSAAKPTQLEEVDPYSPTPAQAAAQYTGEYYSEEIEPAYRIEVAEGRLVVRRLKVAAVTLEPLTRDVFRGSTGTLRFSRDSKGRVTGFTLSSGRIRGFRFSRDARRPGS